MNLPSAFSRFSKMRCFGEIGKMRCYGAANCGYTGQSTPY